MRQLITSILDNDLYKFKMLNAVLKLYPGQQVEYKFYSRDKRKFPVGFYAEFKRQVEAMDKLHLTQLEEIYLRGECSDVFDEEFFDFLREFRFDSSKVIIKETLDELSITISGSWETKILYEVPLMAIISELCFIIENGDVSYSKFKLATALKGETFLAHAMEFMEFGTRRRFSKLAQSLAVNILKITGKGFFLGTSNVYMAMIHNVPALGTVAHEWVMYHGAIIGFEGANTAALKAWKEVYPDQALTSLPDTYTSKVFFGTVPKESAAEVDIFRQDSGEPNTFTDLVLSQFEDTKARTIMYSDGLNTEKAIAANDYRKGEVNKKFCLGTYFTHDFEGITPLNMVIKLHKVNGAPTIKLSDVSGKHTGEPEIIKNCLTELEPWLRT